MNERLVNNSCEPRKEKKVRRSRESQVGDIWVFLFFFDYFVCVQKTLSHVHCIFTKRVSPTYHCLEFLFLSFLYFIYFFFFVRARHVLKCASYTYNRCAAARRFPLKRCVRSTPFTTACRTKRLEEALKHRLSVLQFSK